MRSIAVAAVCRLLTAISIAVPSHIMGQVAAITTMVTITPGASGFPNQVTFSATNLPPATMVAFNPRSVFHHL